MNAPDVTEKPNALPAVACSGLLAGDRGSQMKCSKCLTEWWTKLAGDRCPNCDPKYLRLKSTIMLTLDTKREKLKEARIEITALEQLDAMCGRLDSGM